MNFMTFYPFGKLFFLVENCFSNQIFTSYYENETNTKFNDFFQFQIEFFTKIITKNDLDTKF